MKLAKIQHKKEPSILDPTEVMDAITSKGRRKDNKQLTNRESKQKASKGRPKDNKQLTNRESKSKGPPKGNKLP